MKHFELEQQILDAWRLTDDMKLLAHGGASPSDFDGLATLYELKFERMWDTFEQCILLMHNKNIHQEAVPETITIGPDSDPVQVKTISFVDEANQKIKLNYGDYGDSGWILGIDGDNEQVSVQLKDLSVLINLLKKLVD